MKAKIKLFLKVGASLFIIGIVVGLYMYNKPHKNYSKIQPELHISAAAVLKDYDISEALANEKYLDKIIQVNGKVVDHTFNKNGSFSIYLEDEMFGVTCTIDSSDIKNQQDLIGNLQTGSQISVKGRCDGMLTDVRLSKCTIIQD